MTITKAFDTSRHNHQMVPGTPDGIPIDFEAAYADGYRIWMGRASVGNYYTDPWFQRDFDAAEAAGFICLAYHVTHPELPVTGQIARFKSALGERKPHGIVIDAEVNGSMSAASNTACVLAHYNAFSGVEFGLVPVWLYTNKNYADKYLRQSFDLPLFVANPGPDNGMNTAPMPAMPKLWTEFIAWQKDWKHSIPGVPDPTVDYSEVEMDEEEARQYFGLGDAEPEPEPEPEPFDCQAVLDALNTLNVKLDTALANQADMATQHSWLADMVDEILTNTKTIIDKLDGLDDLPPPPDPEPPPAIEWQKIKVTRDPVANAFFVIGWNQAEPEPKPIMAIFEPRIQFVVGQVLNAYPNKIDADGTIDFWQLSPEHIPAGSPNLFLRADQVTKV